jgi:aspartyl-tRNA(Asn)/glutamyl-tRNA(Gln) amidotransferase subunit B
VLSADKDLAAFFEKTLQTVAGAVGHKIVANWITSEFLREVNDRDWNLANPPITAEDLGELLRLIGDDTISGKIAKTVFEEMVAGNGKPKEIVEKKGLVQVSDEGSIRAMIVKVLNENSGQLAEYVGGREKLYGFFVGQVMKACDGKMNPALVNKILKTELEQRKK